MTQNGFKYGLVLGVINGLYTVNGVKCFLKMIYLFSIFTMFISY